MSGGSERIDLGGVFLPVTTPFDPVTGDLDVIALRANLRRWFEHPVRGVLVAGSTGESVFLDPDERRALIEAARGVLPGGALLLAGTGQESTRATIRATREAVEAGADAVLVKPPAYYRAAMTPEALARHYRAVADAARVPVILYQVPLRLSTLELPAGLVGELARHPNIVGIKDSRGKLEGTAELVERTGDDFQVLVGSGGVLYGGLEVGAVGGIVAAGLLATAEAVGVHAAFREGRFDEAGRLQQVVGPVHDAIVAGMGVPGVKAALDLLGLHGGAPRPPLGTLPEGRIGEARRVLGTAGLLPAGATV